MANDEISGASAPAPDLRGLEARVERLERELAALRGQQVTSRAAMVFENAVTEAAAAVPPPPPVQPAATARDYKPRLRSELWRARSKGPAERATEPPRESLESRLGSQYFNRIAIVLLLTGTAYGMKLAVDRGMIGPVPRVIVGLLAGAALVLWSERFRGKGFATFSYSLKALGAGVLYLALWAGFRLYGLFPPWLALVLMLLVTAWNAYMAWAQNAELLAGYALAGGFATPMLLSTGGNHEIFLFTYLMAMDVATVVLVRLRRWPRLLLGAFPLTVLYFWAWFLEYFRADEPVGITCVFIALFAAVFASVPLGRRPENAGGTMGPTRRMGLFEQIFLPLMNAASVAVAYYAVLEDAHHHGWLAWLMVALAAVYLVLTRLPQPAVASAIHLSIAIVFLTIAVPLKATGHWITVSWLVEGLALTWVATRLAGGDADTQYAASTLRWLAMGSLLLGLAGVTFHVVDQSWEHDTRLLTSATGTALVGILVFACASWLALRAAGPDDGTRAGWTRLGHEAFGAIAVVATILSFREFMTSWVSAGAHPPFATADFAIALLSLAVFGGVIAVSFRMARVQPADPFWSTSAACATIAFNLVAVLTGVREVSAMWQPAAGASSPDAALQQSLAISGFLMLYGAALLAVGFWRRSGFLRWQALALLVFTILKAFLYDMRNLSQGYRVVSLMGLGALLLAVSFAYQKDWLNLKGTGSAAAEQDAP